MPARTLLWHTCLWCCTCLSLGITLAEEDSPTRVRSGLVALYDFADTTGLVRDRSGSRPPLHLEVDRPRAVRRRPGSLEVRNKVTMRSVNPATRLVARVRRSGALTIEAWVETADLAQRGPARIVTLSGSSTQRNITLGQDAGTFDIRLRTTKTSQNGLPSLAAKDGSVQRTLQHLVYTRNRSGKVRIYVEGELHREGDVPGSLTNWEGFHLALANEMDGSRLWKGTYHLVALFDRALSSAEVRQNFLAGAQGETATALVREVADPRAQHFELAVAPLLANHCLECHDAASREGGLDLSRPKPALAGGESGPLLTSTVEDSLLWQFLESDEMPKDRTPLSAAQKDVIKQWIEQGGKWTLAQIDPAIYTHQGRAGQRFLRRLTVDEYVETVRYLTGVEIGARARKLLPQDLRADGFSNTAYNLNVDLKHVEAYRTLAEEVVAQMDVLAFAERFVGKLKFTDKDMGKLISSMGKWVLRGPLEEPQVISYRGISTTVVANGGGFPEAVGLILEAMLQSPQFLYRLEQSRGDGQHEPVNEFELANRLSYMLWGGPPDKALWRAAEAGELFSPEACRETVQRMLDDPRAREHSLRFASEWLHLSRLENLRPDDQKYPQWDPLLAEDMRRETLAFFEDVVWRQDRPMASLLNAQVTFVTDRLARHYGFQTKAPLGKRSADELVRWDLEDEPSRGGLLTQGSVLTIGGDEASMVTRGLFVMHELLRGVVKDPPPCVDTTPVPTTSGRTQRAIAMTRIENKNCGGCHSRFEPLAFGLEKFSGLGHFADEDEHGNALRDDGDVLIPGTAKPLTYANAAELMNTLASSDRVRQSLTWKMTQFALGRPLVAADAAEVEKIHRRAQEAGGRYRDVMTEIVMSDLVQLKQTEAE